MTFMGSRLQAISFDDGLAAVILSLIGTVVFGGLLIAAGHPGDLAIGMFPALLTGALANAAGVRPSDNPKAVLVLCMLVMAGQQAVRTLAALG